MKKIVLLAIIMMIASCATANNLSDGCQHSRDSVRVVTRVETVFINDTINVPVPQQDRSSKTKEDYSHLETDFAESDASVDSTGTLHHTLKNKKRDVPVPTKTPVQYRDSIVYKEIQVPVPYPVEVEVERDLTWWQKTQMIGFWIAILLIMLRYRKAIFGFIRRFI